MKPTTTFMLLLCVLTTGSLLQSRTSDALPAFARREGVKCQMCHLRLPELNEDGHAYIRRGLREEPPSSAPMPGMVMGSRDMAKQPAAATDRALGEALPMEWQNYLSLMGHHTLEAHGHERTSFQAGGLDLWVGGPFDSHWSALTNLAIDVHAGGVDVEQAYVQYNTAWSDRFGSVRAGQMLPLAILFNGGGAAMPLSEPLIFEMPSGAQNPWTPTTLMQGAEIGAVNMPSWSAYVGAGQPRLEAREGAATHTDLYASAELLFGKQHDALSVFGYKGQLIAPPGQAPVDFERAMVFANLYGAREKAVLGALWGSDSPPDQDRLHVAGVFALGEFLFNDRWAGYARYDRIRRDIPAADAETTDGPTLGITFWAQTQVRLTLESRFLHSTNAATDRSAVAEVLWVF